MPEPPTPELLVLCRDVECRAWLAPIAEQLFPEASAPLVVKTWSGAVRSSVQQTRNEFGGVPLGLIANDDPESLEAVEAGADEVVLATALSADSAIAFLDRVLVRARLRREQERLRATYVHSEKLVALGTLVAGVAHEVNNPLTSLLLSAEGLKLRIGPLCNAMSAIEELASSKGAATRDDLVEVMRVGRTGARLTETSDLLQEIESSAQTIARVVRDLKLFARPDDEAIAEIIDVRALLDQVLRIVGRQIRACGVLELDYEPDLPPVVAPSSRLAQVFTNVLLNAAHALTEIERPAHRIRISARADEEAIAVSVSDTGPGIAPHVLSRIFDPFFTTKLHGVGTGLGLSISRSILRRLGGDLLVESVHGDGATFVAIIPRPDRRTLYEAHRQSSGAPPLRNPQTPKKRVMVVDSDEHVLKAVARSLDSQFDVLLARDGQEALDLLASGSRADLILADISRPELSGLQLMDSLRTNADPLETRVILMSAEEPATLRTLPDHGRPLLRKPVSRAVLLTAIDDLMNSCEDRERPPNHHEMSVDPLNRSVS
jgi:signal transduction histidine kinase/FixJ family two-component response regulator